MHATAIAHGAPTLVYGLLAALILLGVRRLRTRTMPTVVALLPATAFLVWSLFGAVAFARIAGPAAALLAITAGIAIGVASTRLASEPRGERLPGGRIRLPGTRLPLILYLGVFIARFACGTWAALVPAQAVLATGIGIAIGAAMTTRLVLAVLRWQPTPQSATA